MIDKIVDREKHIVLESQHPSPLASGKGPDAFLGCDHFKKINELLGMDQIKW
jgi:uracil-DNA glycosylase